ncbi:acetate--CoA ligase family protein [Microbacterium sp. STN6]|uniref:acetate--CoA ligase family protein n=1 Tax=Microbacterium sp. STN6 TaxID=2995588 RepID=UPI0022609C70|nr:acetate--CoA ligase family protein [Microbacterium sp. STN6]MCX7523292.1 acetate--CoA ligase family protein [Microbacterium sp. STN6]
MTRTLDPLFAPKSVAVIGASASPEKAGYAMMQSLSTFAGPLYPINPRAGEVLGHTAYASVGDVEEAPDLAVLVVPPAAVPAALEQCAAAGVRGAVICSGGFAESGAEGEALQNRVAEIARTTGIRVLGPNTSGFINAADAVCANFMPSVTELAAGGVSIVAQSGGVNLALSFMLARANVGLRIAAGLGNAVDVGFVDVLDHFAADDATTAVGLHIEGVSDGRALMAAVRRVAELKPIVVLKVGRNDVGDFAKSHTGALTGSYQVARQALAQSGAVVVETPTELVDALTALSQVRLPAVEAPGVGVITGQAGPGLIIADSLASRHVAVPTLAAATLTAVSHLLPPLTYQKNPVDTGRPGQTFPAIVTAVAGDPAIDLLAVYALDEPGALDPAGALAGAAVPALFASGGTIAALDGRRAALSAMGIPLFDSPDALARGAAAVVDDARARLRLRYAVAEHDVWQHGRPLGHVLDENESKQLFEAEGLTLPARRVAADHTAAERALAELGGPVVVKVLDAAITHKSDVGGVHVGVRTAAELAQALETIDRIPGAPGARRYLIEAQAERGVELIVGATRDAAFGPVVLLGVGGVDVELGGEPILTVAPFGREQALDAIDRLPQSIRAGHRGGVAVDRDALARVLVAVGDVMARHDDIQEIDLNPVRLTSAGPTVLDALVVTAPQENHAN